MMREVAVRIRGDCGSDGFEFEAPMIVDVEERSVVVRQACVLQRLLPQVEV
jgi:hypothetical protein